MLLELSIQLLVEVGLLVFNLSSRCTISHIQIYKTSIKYTKPFSIELQETITDILVSKLKMHILYTWYDKCILLQEHVKDKEALKSTYRPV